MKKSLSIIAIALSATFAASPALADRGKGYGFQGNERGYYDNRQYDRRDNHRWAKVISVKPIVRRIEVPYQRQVCQRYDSYHRDYSGSVAGGVIGGIIGHQFGGGRGNDAATAAGVIIGSLAGSQHDRGYRRAPVERCRTVTEYRYDEVVKGYKVKYRYRGETFVRRMNQRPGDRIRMDGDRRRWNRG